MHFFFKLCHHRPILGIRSLTLSLHNTWKWLFWNGTDRLTARRTWQLYDWIRPEGRFSDMTLIRVRDMDSWYFLYAGFFFFQQTKFSLIYWPTSKTSNSQNKGKQFGECFLLFSAFPSIFWPLFLPTFRRLSQDVYSNVLYIFHLRVQYPCTLYGRVK